MFSVPTTVSDKADFQLFHASVVNNFVNIKEPDIIILAVSEVMLTYVIIPHFVIFRLNSAIIPVTGFPSMNLGDVFTLIQGAAFKTTILTG